MDGVGGGKSWFELVDERVDRWRIAVEAAVGDGEGTIPPAPLDDLAHWLQAGEELDESESLSLLDEINRLRKRLKAFEGATLLRAELSPRLEQPREPPIGFDSEDLQENN